MTIEELIEALERMKQSHGGQVRVKAGYKNLTLEIERVTLRNNAVRHVELICEAP